MSTVLQPPVASPSSPPGWDIVITEWALDSYLNLKHAQTFTDQEYWTVMRPDVKLLHGGIPPTDTKFQNPKFWGQAKQGTVPLSNGYKMKWHNIGSGKVQLRLPVTAGPSRAFLCECYVKHTPAAEQRKLARFKTHINLIAQGRYTYRGHL